jgi:hypothetical protein
LITEVGPPDWAKTKFFFTKLHSHSTNDILSNRQHFTLNGDFSFFNYSMGVILKQGEEKYRFCLLGLACCT